MHLVDDKGDSGPATVSMNLTTDLEGKSAAEAARFVLTRADSRREGMHYQKILDTAVRLGYKRGDDDPSIDTMRRTLSKREDLFEPRGEGVYRLRS